MQFIAGDFGGEINGSRMTVLLIVLSFAPLLLPVFYVSSPLLVFPFTEEKTIFKTILTTIIIETKPIKDT